MAVMAAHDKELNVVILGAEKTGKTALLKKYIESTFTEDQSPSTEADTKKHVHIDGQNYILNLFSAEPSTEARLHQIGQAFVLLYAINNEKSFHFIRQQHKQLKQAKAKALLSTPVFLVGTKADLASDRQVSEEEGRQLAIDLRCQKLFETSARNHTDQIEDLFTKLVREHRRLEQGPLLTRPPMTPTKSAPEPMSPTPTDDSPRRSSVFDRLKFGSMRRRSSVQSLARKKSGSFGESIMTLGSARPSRDNVRSVSYNTNHSNGYPNGTNGRQSNVGSPYRLDVDTSAWRETIKWPTEIIPEEDLRAK